MAQFSIKQRIKSFTYAFNGLKLLILHEHNARIHAVAAACAVAMGWFYGIAVSEWIAIIFAIALVIAFEIVNSAIEKLADVVSPHYLPAIKGVKDLAAAAVLVAAIAAFIIGLIIFTPKIFA